MSDQVEKSSMSTDLSQTEALPSTVDAEHSYIRHSTENSSVIANPKVYQCKQCNVACITPSQLRKHKRRHTDERPFACVQCNKTFMQSTHLTSHLRTVHNNERPHNCSRCCAAFGRITDLKRHAILHQGDTSFSCPHCQGRFRRSTDVTKHVRKFHRKESTVDNSPVELDKSPGSVKRSFPDANKKEIMTKKEVCLKNYTCTYCEEVFSEWESLVKHERIHTGERPYKCETCDKTFRRAAHLKNHEHVHSEARSFRCMYCDKEFKYGHRLESHMMLHSENRPYSCSYSCGASFVRPLDLRVHEATHTGEKPHSCKECDKRFLRRSDLKVHQRKHNGERPFECSQCGKKFLKSGDLVKHTRIHTGEKPYVCSYCGICYRQSHSLKAHFAKKHPGVAYTGAVKATIQTIYPCLQCNLWFTHTSDLKKHETTHPAIFHEVRAVEPETVTAANSISSKESAVINDLISQLNQNTDTGTSVNGQPTVVSTSEVVESQSHSTVSSEDSSSHEHVQTSITNDKEANKRKKKVDATKTYQCRICDKDLPSIRELREHELEHSGIKPFVCKKCGDVFHRESLLSRHELADCGDMPYRCENCGKQFSRAWSLTSHQREDKCNKTAVVLQKFACKFETCRKSFKNSEALELHMKEHEDDKPYLCGSCDASFSQICLLKAHVRETHPTKCEQSESASRNFNDSATLLEQSDQIIEDALAECSAMSVATVIDSETGDEQTLAMSFANDSSGLDETVSEAIKQREWNCPICNAEFSDFSRMENHAKTHGIESLVLLVYPQE